MTERTLVCDTSLLLYLSRIGQLHLLPALFEAAELGMKVKGVVGILLRGKRTGLIPLVQPLLDQLREAGFRLQDDLYREALRLAGEGV